MDVQHHAGASDIGHLKACALHQTESATVDRRQTRAINGNPDFSQNPPHFLLAQDHRELLLARRPEEAQGGPIAVQRLLVEELDPAQRDGRAFFSLAR
jgi:hypothetical protein